METDGCAYVLVRGKKKGTRCEKAGTKAIGENLYCLTHYRLIYPTSESRAPETQEAPLFVGKTGASKKVHFEDRQLELDQEKNKRKRSDSDSEEDAEEWVESRGRVERYRTPHYGEGTPHFFSQLERNCLDAVKSRSHSGK